MKNKKLRESFYNKPCIICSKVPSDPCHLITYASSRKDEEFNIIPLCRIHHVESHKIGLLTFILKHDKVRIYIEAKGWVIENVFGRNRLFRS